MDQSSVDMQSLPVIDLQVCDYRAAWTSQLAYHEKVLQGEYPDGVIILVEHPPVITFGRRPGSTDHLLADAATLALRGVDVVQSDRGGDITFHGPGQLVVYPIIPLRRYNLGVSVYMRLLEQIVIQALAPAGIQGCRDACATGVWVDVPPGGSGSSNMAAVTSGADQQTRLRKICAMGVKLRRWTSLHGLALNVTTDLRYFDLINPCGLSRPVTSMQALLGSRCPPMNEVKWRMAMEFRHELHRSLSKQ